MSDVSESSSIYVCQKKWCSCVYDTLPDTSNRCDLSAHVFVFGANDSYQKRRYGVHLTCIHNKPTLIQKESHKKRNLFCNNKVIPGNFTWQNGRERCKKVSGKLKDVNFHDFCKTNSTKAWVGFGTVSSEEEYMKLSDLLEPKRCQSCGAEVCQFENCSEHRKPNCESETKSTSVNVLYTTSMRPLYTVTTSGGRTQDVTPHQITTSGSQQTTINTSQQRTRLLSQRTTIYSVSITNQTTNNVGNNVNVTGEALILISNTTMSWQEAVEFCARNKQILRKERTGLHEVLSEKFWTRIYLKGHFVYLIGCFQPSQIQTSTSTNMKEAECLRCLNRHPFMFGRNTSANNTWCSCVYGTLPDIPGRCDVSKHVFVFGANDIYPERKHCIQIKCNKSSPLLRSGKCHKQRNLFCNNEVLPGQFAWQNAVDRCKAVSEISNDFKFEDLCKANHKGAWIGFYTTTSEEERIKYSESLEPKSCQSCDKDCTFENCSERRQAICETPTTMRPLPTLTSVLITNQTTHNIASDDYITRDTNVNIKMVLIYTASPLLAAILIVLCVLYMRSKRKRRRKEDLSRQPVREQLYELADNSQLENMVNNQDRADGGLCAGDPVTPGTGQREDIYNHLRERSVDPSQEGEEGVYSRCVGGDDTNDTYDVTFRSKLQFPTRDSVYNHVILFDSSTR
uniref:Uncharacterized protein LOC111118555 isoform X2 n=1 Tax=Crassostrea virginica TaxID=6565 RepID=A0A8B8CDD7_CRAVI|nr:uncharacterized protein LOC111118555 isoform X2 [Crassostrea virginica]